MIAKIVVDPRDANTAYAASMGHVFAPNSQRGVFKTTDGGATWRKVLYINDQTGGIDLVMDPRHPQRSTPRCGRRSACRGNSPAAVPAADSTKRRDGGVHWNEHFENPGFATRCSRQDRRRGCGERSTHRLLRSCRRTTAASFAPNDGGATWIRVNAEMKLRQRALLLYGDHRRSDESASRLRSQRRRRLQDERRRQDVERHRHAARRQSHRLDQSAQSAGFSWSATTAAARVSVDGGDLWSSDHNQPTGQFYHVALDNQFPFHVFGASQDEGAYEGPSAQVGPGIGPGEWHPGRVGRKHLRRARSRRSRRDVRQRLLQLVRAAQSHHRRREERQPVAALHGRRVSRRKRSIASAGRIRSFSRRRIHASCSSLRKSSSPAPIADRRGRSSVPISRVTIRALKARAAARSTWTKREPKRFPTFPRSPSRRSTPSILWAGSADGLVHVTTDHGGHWNLVTPPQLPQWAQISSIEPSHTDKGTAYLTASRYMWDDYHPYVYETTDYGAHWTTLTNGLPDDQYVFVVRQDPREPRLLFAGTRSTAYVSLDGGSLWQPLTLNLPGVQVRDLAIDAREGSSSPQRTAARFGSWITSRCSSSSRGKPRTRPQTCNSLHPKPHGLSQCLRRSGSISRCRKVRRKSAVRCSRLLQRSVRLQRTASVDALVPRSQRIDDPPLYAASEEQARKETDSGAARRISTQNQRRQHELDEFTAVEARDESFPMGSAVCAGLRLSAGSSPQSDATIGRTRPTVRRSLPGTTLSSCSTDRNGCKRRSNVRLDPRIHPAAGDLEARLALEMADHSRRSTGSIARSRSAWARATKLPPAQRAQIDDEIASLIADRSLTPAKYDVLHPTKIREQLGVFARTRWKAAYAKPTAAEYAAVSKISQALATAGEARLAGSTQNNTRTSIDVLALVDRTMPLPRWRAFAFGTMLAACAQHGRHDGSRPTRLNGARLSDAISAAMQRSEETKKYATRRGRLSGQGGAFCIPAFGGFGGTLEYPGRQSGTINLTLTSSTTTTPICRQLGVGKPIFYLQLWRSRAQCRSATKLKAGGGLTGTRIVSGKHTLLYGQARLGNHDNFRCTRAPRPPRKESTAASSAASVLSVENREVPASGVGRYRSLLGPADQHAVLNAALF